ncbi:MAG: NAD(P)-dependent oxidoreductase, partial [Bacillota bacterium]
MIMLLVTGITGHSGRWFLKRLKSENYPGKIRCIIRSSRETALEQYSIFENCNLDLEFVVGDLKDEVFLLEALKDVDTIVHIAGISLSSKLFFAAIENGVDWAILVHTTGRYSKYKNASDGYIQIEDEILNRTIYAKSGERCMNCTILRPTMIYGSSQDRNMYRLVEYLNTHRFFPLFGDGKNLMQPVHARDLGNAYYDVLHSPDITMNREYNLSGRDPLTYLKIIETIKKNLNSKVKIIKLPITLSI